MGALPSLPRVWWSIDLPGYREHLKPFSTYSGFAFAELPPIERELDPQLSWLRGQPRVPRSLGDVEARDPVPELPVTGPELDLLVTDCALELPSAFRTFISDPEPRTHVRSSTLCYLDLAQFRVDVVDGGSLIHFLSDQQWVLHWLLYAGSDGSEAVVATASPFGFDVEGESFAIFDPGISDASVCAESFSEFLYRFWIENEIWLRSARKDTDEPLTDEQLRYAEHYR